MALIARLNFFENFLTLSNLKRMAELIKTDHQNFHRIFFIICKFLFFFIILKV